MKRRSSKVLVLSTVLIGAMTGVAIARHVTQPSTPAVLSMPVHVHGTSHASPQNQSPASQAPPHSLKLALDGEQNPELIPDELAYRHLLAATALSYQLSPSAQAGVRARIAKIGLSGRDAQYYESILAALRVRDELNRIAKERTSLASAAAERSQSAIARLQNLRIEEDDLMHYAKEQVALGLTPEGKAKLNDYVQLTVKRQIKILRGERVAHGH